MRSRDLITTLLAGALLLASTYLSARAGSSGADFGETGKIECPPEGCNNPEAERLRVVQSCADVARYLKRQRLSDPICVMAETKERWGAYQACLALKQELPDKNQTIPCEGEPRPPVEYRGFRGATVTPGHGRPPQHEG